MSSDAIEVRGVGKAFRIYDKPHHRLLQMLWRGRRSWYREFQALQDVSFSLARGETLGIIGRNGAGKSTLLQIICGTLQPTAGEARVHGRIAALLEVEAEAVDRDAERLRKRRNIGEIGAGQNASPARLGLAAREFL